MAPEDIDKLYEQYVIYWQLEDISPSDEMRIRLLLEVAIEVAKERACDIREWDFDKLPKSIVLGILTYTDLAMKKEDNFGISSESIGGMSQSFDSNFINGDPDSYYNDTYAMFDRHCRRKMNNSLQYVPLRRGGQCKRKGWRNY